MNMIKIIKIFTGILLFLACLMTGIAKADILYFTNGKKMEGLIQEETEQYVKIELGFGSVKISKSKIEKIMRGEEAEIDLLKQQWEIDKQERKKAQQQRKEIEKAQEQLEDNLQVKREIKKTVEKVLQKDIVKYIQRGNGIGVEALLNNKVKVTLLFDTGATDVFLRPHVKKALGLGLISRQVSIILGDGSKTSGQEIVLKSVRVGNLNVKNIKAIILSDVEGRSTWDGALGMSFLENFEVKIDAKNKKLILEEKK